MATGDLATNLRKIRGEAIYGLEMREAIASAIEQADDETANLLNSVKTMVESRELYFNVNSLGSDDYQVEIVNPT